jgi:6-hydroxytryprostatin B O-methyltransferase
MGGSDCHASLALATAYPNLSFIVQDLPDTIVNGPVLISSSPEQIRSRISCQAHDFFTPQTVTDADVYFLRMIFHDWPDKEAATILRNLLPVLVGRPSARLIIMDTILPDPGTIPTNEEALLRVRDLTMLQAFNSKERELNDWKTLFATVSAEKSGGALKLQNVTKPFGSLMSLMEITWVADEAPNGTNGVNGSRGGGNANGIGFSNGVYQWQQ